MKRTLCIIIAALVLIPFLSVSAKITFHTDLESAASIRRAGGEVLGGGQFVPGVVGNGFMSDERSAVVHFPFEVRWQKKVIDEVASKYL